MIHDMKEGISMYLVSGVFTCFFAYFPLWMTLINSIKIIGGEADILSIFSTVFGAFATVFFIVYGIRLIRFYRKLRERYGKLLEMEKKIED